LTGERFGCHVARRTDDRAVLGETRFAERQGDAEIAQPQYGTSGTSGFEQQVRGLDVPVHQPRRVHLIERTEQLRQQFRRIPLRQRPEVGQQTAHRTTADQIHRQQSLIVLSRPAVRTQHMRMIQPEPLLAYEPQQRPRMPLPKHLCRTNPPQPPIPRPPNQAVPTRPHRINQLIPPRKHIRHTPLLSPIQATPTIEPPPRTLVRMVR
jgi:hypothetical protein